MSNFVPHLHPFPTNFGVVLKKSPPSAPPGLFSTLRRRATGPDKVRVAIRLLPKECEKESETGGTEEDVRNAGCRVPDEKVSICINDRRKQLTLQTAQIAPKMFNFDYIFNDEAAQAEVCASVLPSVLQTVVAGSDGCILCYGQPKTGKTYTMIGEDESLQTIGVVPAALSWLYRLIADNKSKYGTRYSIRASAYAITALGPSPQGATAPVDARVPANITPMSPSTEALVDAQSVFDLLEELEAKPSSAAGVAESSKHIGSNRNSPNLGFQHVTELKAPCVTRAAFLLDAAISRLNELYSEHKISESTLHFVFSLSIYQRRASHDSNRGESSVRSRLLFIDLAAAVTSKTSSNENIPQSPLYATLDPEMTSSSDVTSQTQLPSEAVTSLQKAAPPTSRTPISEDETNQDFNQYHSAMQNALLNLLNGGRTNFPCKLVSILREIFCGGSCRTVVIGHVSAGRPQQSELVKTVSFIAKLYRNKRPSNRSKHSGWSPDQWSPAAAAAAAASAHCSQLRAPSSNSCPEDTRSPFSEGFSSDANSEVPLGAKANTGSNFGCDENMKRLIGQALINPCGTAASEFGGGISRILHSSHGSVSPESQLIPSESSAFVPIARPHNVTVSTAQSVKFPSSNSSLAKPIPSYQLYDFDGQEKRASLLRNNSSNITNAQSDTESQYTGKRLVHPSSSNFHLSRNSQLSYEYRIGNKFLPRSQPDYSSDSERCSNQMTSASDTEVLEPRSNVMMGYLNASKLSLIEESEVAKINAFNDLRKRNMHLRNARPGTPQCKNRLLGKTNNSQQNSLGGSSQPSDCMVQNRLSDLSNQNLGHEKNRMQKKGVSSVLFSHRMRSRQRKNQQRANSLVDSSASNANLWISSNTPYLPWRRLDYIGGQSSQNVASSQGSLNSEGGVSSSCFGLKTSKAQYSGIGTRKYTKMEGIRPKATKTAEPRDKNLVQPVREKDSGSHKGVSNKRRKSFLQTIRKKLFGSTSLPCSPLNSLTRSNEASASSKLNSIERKRAFNINPSNSGPPSKNLQPGCSYPNSQAPPNQTHNSPPNNFLNNPYENYHSIFYNTEGLQPAVKSMSRMGLSLNLQCNNLALQQNPMSDSDSGIESLASSTNHKFNHLRGIVNSRSFGHSYDSIADIRVTPHMNYPQQRLPQLPRSDSYLQNNRWCSPHCSQTQGHFCAASGHHSDQESDRTCCSFQRYMTNTRQTPQPLRSQTFVLTPTQPVGRFSCGHSAHFQEQWVDGFKSNPNSSELTSRKSSADQDPQQFAETLSQRLQHLKMK